MRPGNRGAPRRVVTPRGSGLGDYASRWLRAGVPHITATEVDADRLALLKERFRKEPRVSVTGIDVFNPPPGQYSSFDAVNVLEHIADQVRALRAAHAMVRPGVVPRARALESRQKPPFGQSVLAVARVPVILNADRTADHGAARVGR